MTLWPSIPLEKRSFRKYLYKTVAAIFCLLLKINLRIPLSNERAWRKLFIEAAILTFCLQKLIRTCSGKTPIPYCGIITGGERGLLSMPAWFRWAICCAMSLLRRIPFCQILLARNANCAIASVSSLAPDEDVTSQTLSWKSVLNIFPIFRLRHQQLGRCRYIFKHSR